MPAETINIEYTYLTRGHTYFVCDRKFVVNDRTRTDIVCYSDDRGHWSQYFYKIQLI